MGRFRFLLVASLATFILGCVTWDDYHDSPGAGKADAKVAVFKAHLDDTRQIVSASSERVEYQYDPARTQMLFTAHPLVRLLPGQYIITAKTWPFGSLYEFEVDLKAGHKYRVDTSLCSLECIATGKPYRHDRWIQDLTTRERISDVVSECYLAKPRREERQRVPCPDEEDYGAPGIARKANAAVAIVEENYADSGGASKANAEVATDEEEYSDSGGASEANPEVATDEEEYSDSGGANKANAEVATDEEEYSDSGGASEANPEVAIVEEDYRDTRGAGKEGPEVAIFKVDLDITRQIVHTSDGRTEYQYDPELKRASRSAPGPLIRLRPGQYTVTAKTRPFGSLYEFEADLKAGHTYELENHLCSLKCILNGEPYRHDRWIQDLTAGERITGIESECYLGKNRRRERQKVPCPD